MSTCDEYVMCVSNEFYPLSLTRGKRYRVLDRNSSESIYIIDDTGEGYWYSTTVFIPVEAS